VNYQQGLSIKVDSYLEMAKWIKSSAM
jgi:hypothetical protein